MSHFAVFVFGGYVDRQLEKYDESITVKEYVRGVVSEEEKLRMVNFYNEKYQFDGTFEECYSKYGDNWNYNRWRKDSEGIWQEYSTYNPKSKWDWYVEGGRWDGEIIKKKGRKKNVNSALKRDIDFEKTLIPFAFVHKGIWYEKGEMGWFGMTRNEIKKDDWDKFYLDTINSLPDKTRITLIDAHI